jgi:predicted nuclease of predicted toxin-antitoxin system
VVAFLFDQHVPVAVSNGLRLREVNVLTAFEDGSSALEDEALLARATALGRVLVTQDEDFLGIAIEWQRDGRDFAGIVYAHQLRVGWALESSSLTWN